MSVRDVALAAYGAQAQAEAAREQAERDERQARERRRSERAQQTINASPLGEWFPGVTWDVMAYARNGAAEDLDVYDGREIVVAPRDRSVCLMLERGGAPDATVHVRVVSRHTDRDTHYSYWSGPLVENVAQIGAWIATMDRMEQAAARR